MGAGAVGAGSGPGGYPGCRVWQALSCTAHAPPACRALPLLLLLFGAHGECARDAGIRAHDACSKLLAAANEPLCNTGRSPGSGTVVPGAITRSSRAALRQHLRATPCCPLLLHVERTSKLSTRKNKKHITLQEARLARCLEAYQKPYLFVEIGAEQAGDWDMIFANVRATSATGAGTARAFNNGLSGRANIFGRDAEAAAGTPRTSLADAHVLHFTVSAPHDTVVSERLIPLLPECCLPRWAECQVVSTTHIPPA